MTPVRLTRVLSVESCRPLIVAALALVAVGCGEGAMRRIVGTEADQVARAALVALATADSSALDTIIAPKTRSDSSFPAFARGAARDIAGAQISAAQLTSVSIQSDNVRQLWYSMVTDSSRFVVRIRLESIRERWFAETIQIDRYPRAR
jgi:hypothetical protein